MADFKAIKTHLLNNISYLSFFPNSQKPIKTVIGHILPDTPTEDICEGLMNLGFGVVGVK
jgi:hypothetical protein